MSIPVSYKDDPKRVEQILLQTAERHTVKIGEMSEGALQKLQDDYDIYPSGLKPKVYYRLTDNRIELTVRFIAKEHGSRELKDAMSRDILEALGEAGIGIASTTYEIVGLPPLRLEPVRLENVSQNSSGRQISMK